MEEGPEFCVTLLSVNLHLSSLQVPEFIEVDRVQPVASLTVGEFAVASSKVLEMLCCPFSMLMKPQSSADGFPLASGSPEWLMVEWLSSPSMKRVLPS